MLQYACEINHHQQCKVGEQTTARTMYSRIRMATHRPTCEQEMLILSRKSQDTSIKQAPTCVTQNPMLCTHCNIVEHVSCLIQR